MRTYVKPQRKIVNRLVVSMPGTLTLEQIRTIEERFKSAPISRDYTILPPDNWATATRPTPWWKRWMR